MELSKYTIFSKLKDSTNWFIINLLTGEADILDESTGESIQNGDFPDPQPYIEKGYIMDPREEEKLFKSRYLDFKEQQEKSETQIFYVPTYQCNFACTYCYQESYENPPREQQLAVMDSFFSHLDRNFAGKPFYVTLFGGEPLLPDKISQENISYFLDEADKRNISLAVVTNGYSLDSYLHRLQRSNIREIQITLDGVGEIHDKRRPLKGGQPTFEKVAQNISSCLNAGISVNLRAVVDKQNIKGLVDLARYAIRNKWTESPLFKTQLGRNYELHTCQSGHKYLFSRVEMYQELYTLLKDYPEIGDFHTPAFSISRFLHENGELPEPLFDSCPGGKTEWAFDYTGKIFPCTAMVGKAGEELGQFYPESFLEESKCDPWQDRDVLAISECRDCSLQLACGGGCGAVSKNRTGTVLSPDCRPVKELMEMGISLYFNQGDI